MNICIFSYFFSPIYPGNGTRYPLILAESLVKDGHKVKVITAFPQNLDGTVYKEYRHLFFRREFLNGVELVRVWVPPIKHFGFMKRMILYSSFMISSTIGISFVGKTDIILGTSPEPPFLIIPGFFLNKFKRAPYVLTLGDLWPNNVFDLDILNNKLIIELVKFSTLVSFNLSKNIVVITNSIRTGLLNNGISSEKVSVVELGVDTNCFKSKKKDIELEEGLFNNKFVVMYSGIFGPTYDFDILLKAAKLLEHLPDILFIIRGDGECKEQIVAKISKLSLTNVRVLGPVSNTEKVIDYLNSADLFVIPMKNVKVSETAHPSKLFEYLACEKPVICCAKGELADLVKTAECGLVVEPDDCDALAKSIQILYIDTQKRLEMGKKGRAYVIQNFSYEIIGKKLVNILKRTFSKRSLFSEVLKNNMTDSASK